MGSYKGRTNGDDTCVGDGGSGLDETGDEGRDEFDTAGVDGAGDGVLIDHYPHDEDSGRKFN